MPQPTETQRIQVITLCNIGSRPNSHTRSKHIAIRHSTNPDSSPPTIPHIEKYHPRKSAAVHIQIPSHWYPKRQNPQKRKKKTASTPLIITTPNSLHRHQQLTHYLQVTNASGKERYLWAQLLASYLLRLRRRPRRRRIHKHIYVAWVDFDRVSWAQRSASPTQPSLSYKSAKKRKKERKKEKELTHARHHLSPQCVCMSMHNESVSLFLG